MLVLNHLGQTPKASVEKINKQKVFVNKSSGCPGSDSAKTVVKVLNANANPHRTVIRYSLHFNIKMPRLRRTHSVKIGELTISNKYAIDHLRKCFSGILNLQNMVT